MQELTTINSQKIMELKKRIEALAAWQGVTPRGLAKLLETSPQNLYDISRGRAKRLSPRLAKAIREKFPEVSPGWLATGEGEMLQKDREKVEQVQTITHTTAANITQTQTAGGKGEECGRLWRLVEDLRREINTLLGIIDRLTGRN